MLKFAKSGLDLISIEMSAPFNLAHPVLLLLPITKRPAKAPADSTPQYASKSSLFRTRPATTLMTP